METTKIDREYVSSPGPIEPKLIHIANHHADQKEAFLSELRDWLLEACLFELGEDEVPNGKTYAITDCAELPHVLKSREMVEDFVLDMTLTIHMLELMKLQAGDVTLSGWRYDGAHFVDLPIPQEDEVMRITFFPENTKKIVHIPMKTNYMILLEDAVKIVDGSFEPKEELYEGWGKDIAAFSGFLEVTGNMLSLMQMYEFFKSKCDMKKSTGRIRIVERGNGSPWYFQYYGFEFFSWVVLGVLVD